MGGQLLALSQPFPSVDATAWGKREGQSGNVMICSSAFHIPRATAKPSADSDGGRELEAKMSIAQEGRAGEDG